MNELFYDNRIAGLILKYLQKKTTKKEVQELQDWVDSSPRAKELFEELTSNEKLDLELAHFVESRKKVLAKIHALVPEIIESPIYQAKWWQTYLQTAAAIIAMIVGLWIFDRYNYEFISEHDKPNQRLFALKAGPDETELVWDNGISLLEDNPMNRYLTNKATAIDSKNQCQFVYDSTFVRGKKITKEVYFEVGENFIEPFAVTLCDIDMQVWGPNFCVSAYENDSSLRVGCVEGIVLIKADSGLIKLNPGERTIIARKSATPQASRQAYFYFENFLIGRLMNEVEKWYDVQVDLEGYLKNKLISGAMPVHVDPSKALELLLPRGIDFKIEGNRVEVMCSNIIKTDYR